MGKESHFLIYIGIVLLFIISTVLMFILMEVSKPVKYTYLVFKVFFVVLFVLYMHKYLMFKFRKYLNIGINELENTPDLNLDLLGNDPEKNKKLIENSPDFNQNLIDYLFKGW